MTSPATPPAQKQQGQPGRQAPMHPAPKTIRDGYRGSGKLERKIALVSGGDSGIGRAAAVHLAREGADVVIAYLDEDEDAQETLRLIAQEGRSGHAVRADLSSAVECRRVVRQAVEKHGRIDVLVHSIAQQYPQAELADVTPEQLEQTFRTNVYSAFFLAQAALPQMPDGAAIVLTGSVTGARGKPELMDYASTKGAIHTLCYSLAQALAPRRIRVNVVAPGPIWTPLIPSSYSAEQVAHFGASTLMKRPGQPAEVGPAYVFLASEDASFVTGQLLHVNGGSFIGD